MTFDVKTEDIYDPPHSQRFRQCTEILDNLRVEVEARL